MAYQVPGLMFSRVAGADLSGSQFHFVELNTDSEATVVGTAGAPALGVLQNDPGTGEAGNIMFYGISKVVAGETIAVGDLIASNASGQAVVATVTTADTNTGETTGSHVLGIAIEGGDADDVISVFLQPMGAVPGTSA